MLLTDGRDLGSKASLAEAIAAARRANVVVYAIAAGARADTEPLAALASATGGRVFAPPTRAGLARAYRSLGRELARTWQLSYLSQAWPGDRGHADRARRGRDVGRRSAPDPGQTARSRPRSRRRRAQPAHGSRRRRCWPRCCSLARAPSGAVAVGRPSSAACSSRTSRSARSPSETGGPLPASRLCFAWTERSLDDLPGSQRLATPVERSGLQLRVGHLPYLAVARSARPRASSARSPAHRPRSPSC